MTGLRVGYRANRTRRTMFGRPSGRLQSKLDKTRRTGRTMFDRPMSTEQISPGITGQNKARQYKILFKAPRLQITEQDLA